MTVIPSEMKRNGDYLPAPVETNELFANSVGCLNSDDEISLGAVGILTSTNSKY